MSVPGEGSVPMPEATLKQLKEQTNVSQNYLWNARDYTYAMAGEVQNGSKTYVGIRMTPRKPQPGLENLVVYFDKASGLVCYLTSEVSVAVQNGSEPQRMSVRMDLGNFKTFGKVKLPSEYRVQINNIEWLLCMQKRMRLHSYVSFVLTYSVYHIFIKSQHIRSLLKRFDFRNGALDQLSDIAIGHTDNKVVADIDGEQHLHRIALPDGFRHIRCDLPI